VLSPVDGSCLEFWVPSLVAFPAASDTPVEVVGADEAVAVGVLDADDPVPVASVFPEPPLDWSPPLPLTLGGLSEYSSWPAFWASAAAGIASAAISNVKDKMVFSMAARKWSKTCRRCLP